MWKEVKVFLMMSWVSLNIYAGLPNPTATTLFAPPNGLIEPQDVEKLGTILNLPLYQDSEDNNLYYYVPPFRILPWDQGAASVTLHSVKSENIFQADNIMKRMQSEELVPPEHIINGPVVVSKRQALERALERLEKYEDRYFQELDRLKARILELESDRKSALADNKADLIVFFEKMIVENEERIAAEEKNIEIQRQKAQEINIKFDDYVAECAEKWRHERMRTRLYPVTTYLASAGKSIDMGLYPDTEQLAVAINNAIDELKKSYGGTLSMNIYSGFTQKQVDDITFLRAKYWPHVKIVLMASEDLEFESLAEIEATSKGDRQNLMFKNMRGSGGYQGASVAFDLTIDGAMSLGVALGPFIVPVGVTANITQRMLPFEAELKCDFKERRMDDAKAQVRDGKVILPEDLSHITGTRDSDYGSCELKVLKGDENSARVMALKEIEKEFDAINMKKTQLGQSEARNYYAERFRDFKLGKLKPKDHLFGLFNSYSPIIDSDLLLKALGKGNKDFWQTTDAGLSRFYSLYFTKRFSYDGSHTVRTGLPAFLCLFFNADKNAYDRCTRSQEEKAEAPLEAAKVATSSPACQDFESLKDCFDKRKALAPELHADAEEKEKDDIQDL